MTFGIKPKQQRAALLSVLAQPEVYLHGERLTMNCNSSVSATGGSMIHHLY